MKNKILKECIHDIIYTPTIDLMGIMDTFANIYQVKVDISIFGGNLKHKCKVQVVRNNKTALDCM